MPDYLLLAGTEDGVFLLEGSTNREGWRKKGQLLSGKSVSSLALERSTNAVYAGLFNRGGIMKISRNRDVWSISPSGLEGRDVWTVAVASVDPVVVFAGTEPPCVYRSEDLGSSWEELRGIYDIPSYRSWYSPWGDADLNSIAIDTRTPERMYIGVEVGGCCMSSDGGSTWIEADQGLHKDVHHLALHPLKPSYLYAATAGGVYVSDSARLWMNVSNGLKHSYVRALAVDPKKPEVFYVAPMRGPWGGDLRVYRTSDRGSSWEEIGRGLLDVMSTSVERRALICDQGDPAGLYLGTADGRIFVSISAGDAWTLVAQELPPVHCLLFVYEDQLLNG